MSFASKYNKGGKFTADTKAFADYVSLEKLYNENGKNKVYKILAMYINKKTQYKPAPVFAVEDKSYSCGGYYVNIPEHMTEAVTEIMADDQAIAEINSGMVGFSIETYEAGKYGNKLCYGVRFEDL